MSAEDFFPRVISASEGEWKPQGDQFGGDREAPLNQHLIFLILSGEAVVRNVERRWSATAGSAILLNGAERVSCEANPALPGSCRYKLLRISPGSALALVTHVRDKFGPVLRMPLEGETAGILAQVVHRSSHSEYVDRFHAATQLFRLLTLAFRDQVATVTKRDPIEFSYEYIRNHFADPINLKEIARHAGVSREHLIRRFTKRFGFTPGDFLRAKRLESARQILVFSKLNVAQVAQSCGFLSSNSFSQAFKARFGHTPGQMRRLHSPLEFAAYRRLAGPLGKGALDSLGDPLSSSTK